MALSDRPMAGAILLALGLCAAAPSLSPAQSETDEPLPDRFVRLFNGRDLRGWEGDQKVFRVEDGAIVGGSLEKPLGRNEFLCTTREYGDFELRLQAKLIGPPGSGRVWDGANAGIQFRSKRAPNHHEVIGFQADMAVEQTLNKWGSLYDEARRRVRLALADQELITKIYKPRDWNDYTIRCRGRRIVLSINGHQTVDYTELDDKIPLTGILGLQVHGGPPSEAWYRNIIIKELPAKSSNEEDDEDEEGDEGEEEDEGKGGAATDARRAAARAVANLDVYPGLSATLFAAEPEMLSPTNLDVDHRGRVWVCEVVNYAAHGANDLRPKGDRILILEDTDGDGQADLHKTYYQGRDIDSAMGICVLGNKVIVTRAPNIIVFTDDDGDDRPDRKEMLFTKTGGQQNDHSTHSFLFGPDGKLYWNMGNAGRIVRDKFGEVVVDESGNPVIAREIRRRRRIGQSNAKVSPYYGGMVFRCNLDGSEFEVLGHNFRNNYEATVDSFGTVWQSDNDDDGNRGCRINYVMEYGNFGYRDEMTGAGWFSARTGQHEDVAHRHWHQNDPGVVPNFVYTGAGSPAGITVYEGRLLPEVFWDQVIHCDAGPGVVWAAPATVDGAGFTGHTVNIVKGERDRWSRPVDVAVAPDGSLFVTDWYDPYVGWNRQGDVGRGRIFRIAPTGHKYQTPQFDFNTPGGATRALANPCSSVRYLAWTALNKMQEKAEPEMAEMFGSENPRDRARALWLLTKIKGREAYYVEAAIKDDNPNIRIVALRAARQGKLDLLPLVRQLIDDPSPQVRRECAIALRHNRSAEAARLWAELAVRHDGHDRWYLEALGIAADAQWDAMLDAWLKKVGREWNTPAGRDVLWRSRAAVTPGYLAKILSLPDLSQADAARYLRAFDFQAESDEKRAALVDLALASPGGNVVTPAFIAAEALLRLNDFDIQGQPQHKAAVESVLGHVHGTPQFAQLVQKFELADHYPALMDDTLGDPTSPAAIAAVRTVLEAGKFEVVRRLLSGDDREVAVKTAQLLGSAQADGAVDLLVEVLLAAKVSQSVRIEAVRSIVRAGGAEVLLDLARDDRFPEEFKEIAGGAIAGTLNVFLRNEAAELFPMPPMKNNEPLPQMTELLVYIGNPERGKEVFTKATCVTCHKAQGQGVDFGPDLSAIGTKLDKSAIYEAILNPASGVATGYEAYTLELESGKLVSGLIVSETEDNLTLKLPGGAIVGYDVDEVFEKRRQSTSAMPTGLLQLMTVDELVDLVEYLSTLRQ